MQHYIFVDGSYFCFYRFFALKQWWRNAFPEEALDLENPVFVDKFRKTFVETLQQLPKKLKLPKGQPVTLVVGKDCKREQIWRTELYPMYKATRASVDGVKTFFQLVYEEDLFHAGGATQILAHPRLEADDCIALAVKRLCAERPDCQVVIITSDHDYLQLNCPQVRLVNLAFKPMQSDTGDAARDLQLKILMGDVSDNIPSVFPKCGLKTALKCLDDTAFLEKKMANHPQHYAQRKLNETLVDFNCIPEEYANEFLSAYQLG
jgi:5'-3' exonuclease